MQRQARPGVDYEEAAPTYAAGRGLEPEALAEWGAAARPHLAALASGPVLDLGSGTGIFTAALAAWAARPVVAVEPSPAMRTAAAERPGHGAAVVGAVAEALPLRTAGASAAWLSAVVHHLADVGAAAGELRRVLLPGAPVLLRGFFRGRSRVSWMAHFPGHERGVARFPTVEEVTAAFAPAGFEPVAVDAVVERRATHAAAAAWARRMHHADSLLVLLADEELAAGVRALEADPDAEGETVLHLLVLRRR